MEKVLVLLLIVFALAESFSTQRGLIINLEKGELCLQSIQCKSRCCRRLSGLSMARCDDKAPEHQECSPEHIYGMYYKCPCESGLTCEVDRTIVGSITNSDFGICHDSKR